MQLIYIHTVNNMVVLFIPVKIVKSRSCLLFISHKNILNVFTQNAKPILLQIKSVLSGDKCIIGLELRTHLPFKPHFMVFGKIKLTRIQNLFLLNFKISKILHPLYSMLWKKPKKLRQNLKKKNKSFKILNKWKQSSNHSVKIIWKIKIMKTHLIQILRVNILIWKSDKKMVKKFNKKAFKLTIPQAKN